MFRKFILLSFFASIITLSGCHILNPSTMFRDIPDSLTNFSINAPPEYKIAINDIIQFSLFTNDGNKLIDAGLVSGTSGNAGGLTYLVDIEGQARLPVLGRINMLGLTIREAEKMLEKEYSKFFVDPFVTLKVTNRRIIVFPGAAGSGHVLNLQNENTTLLEALAQVGGIPQTGKAHKIKLIRRSEGRMQVQMIDLSRMKGLPDAQIVMQANDIVYIQTTPRISQGILAEVSPILGLVSTFLLSVSLIKQFSK